MSTPTPQKFSINPANSPKSHVQKAQKTKQHHPLRFLKSLLTNRFAWTILVILAELIILIALYLLLYSNFFPVTIFAVFFSLAITLYIINYYHNLEMRLLWAFIVVSLPIIGPLLFIIFASNGRNQTLRDKCSEFAAKLKAFYPNNSALSALQKENPVAALQARYICETNHISLSKNTQTTYFPDGETYFERLLTDLKTARSFIFLEFFIICPGRIWNEILATLQAKVQQGIKVYVMYDDIGSIFTLPSRYYRDLEAIGIHCTPSNKFNSRLNGFHNNRDHRKVVVIDGQIGYTGGINLADEYANLKTLHGHWKDTGLRLEGPAVTNLLTLFLTSWNLHSKTPLPFDQFLPKNTPKLQNTLKPQNTKSPISTQPETTKNSKTTTPQEGYTLVYGSGPTPIYDQPVAKNVYLNLINSATKSLRITTPYLVCDSEIMNALALAAEKGVNVEIITPHIPDKKIVYLMTRSNYLPLIERGVKIYEYKPGFIHAKTMLCDDDYGICGTINLDFRSLIYHFECAAWMYQTSCLADMSTDFETTKKSCIKITPETARLKQPLRLIAETLKVFAPLF